MSERHHDIDIATTPELAAMAAGGDVHAFARLVRLHSETMTRVAWLVTGDMPAAAAAARSAWVAAWMGLRKPHEPGDLDAWLCLLATVEAERVVGMAVAGVLPPGWPDWNGESTLDLGRLAPADRSLLALHHLAGLTPDELDRLAARRVRHAAAAAAVRLMEAWSAVGLDAASAPVRIAAMAAVRVQPIDADAVARLARFEERETRLRLVSAAIGLTAGLIVMLVPILVGLTVAGS